MEARSSARRRRAVLAVAAAAALALPLAGAVPADADPGDSGRMEKLNQQISKLDRAYGGDLAKLKDAQFGVQKAMKSADALRKERDDAQRLVAQLAANQYMTGGGDPALTAISADDPSGFLNTASLAQHLATNQAARVQQVQKLIDEQVKARKEAEQKIKDLQKEIDDLKRQRTRIQALVKKYKPQSPSVGMGGVTPRMMHVKQVIDSEFGPFPTIGCTRPGDPQDHGTGRACDFMESGGGSMPTAARQQNGDQVAAYAISHASSLGIKYVIWRQRIYDMRSPGWRAMENRGGITANHYDHVHISVF
ncbi:hypothetical protein BTM25_02520 [Actinomadura rubteroloni]|uniref:ARB-07466-like C-terminal domain-containing protein n=1 Tax=Actinomadura rubteroloni TaxID=1926885 RepID=A0A2P4ULJ3_9ACTN|nr:DUF4200 domain-containing protein [Actinomadura rubteroloni]POM25869.1 hypothetical protein BTM25_02520 [Actinomadura rubteroloni]